jgi:hypothetical protein
MASLGFELDLVQGNPNLTFIFFMALVLLGVLGLRFAYYALRNLGETDLAGQKPIWRSLFAVGVVASLYAFMGIVDIVSTIETPFAAGLMLALVLLIAFAIRAINYASNSTVERSPWNLEQLFGLVFGAYAVIALVVTAILGLTTQLVIVLGVGGVLFAGYGFFFGWRQMQNTRLHGTLIDSLVRHLLPILAFASLVTMLNLIDPFLPRIIIRHVQVVFIIMTATVMMTATIKLRQNLSSL